MKLITKYDPLAPAPLRWFAYDDDTYDCDWDGERWIHGPHGSGTTEQEAIDELNERMADHAEVQP
jgi:hypothetical protein